MKSYIYSLAKAIVLTLAVAWTHTAFAQPSNDAPCGAIPLSVSGTCNFQVFATNGATRSSVQNPSCGNYQGSNDVWFVALVPSSGTLEISTQAGSLNNMSMAIYSAASCNGPFTEIACATNGSVNTNMPRITRTNLTPGSYVFIRVWDRVCNNLLQCGLPTDGYQQGTFGICAREATDISTGTPPQSTGSYNCNNTPRAGNTCAEATPICSFNGFCGSTSGYSANFWYSGSNGLGGPLTAQGVFCGSIENNSFIKFIAGATRVELDVIVSGAANQCGDGVQFMMFGHPNGDPACGSMSIVSYGCLSPMPRGNNRFVATGLTVGREYYLMVDGFGGDRCNYQINAISGVLIGITTGQSVRTVCLGQPVSLSVFGAGPGTIFWSGPFLDASNNTGQTITFTPTSTGTFTYIVDAPNVSPICSGINRDYDTLTVNVIAPNVNLVVNQSGGCSGGASTITVSGAQSYTYFPFTGVSATTGNSITVTPAVPTTYTITASGANGCLVKRDVDIIPSGGPQMAITASDTIVCSGSGGVTLTASPGFNTYTWSPAAGLSSTTAATVTANPAAPGVYTYTVTGTFSGCPNASASVTVRVLAPQTITVSPAAPAICQGESVTLTASPAGLYNWTGTGGFVQNGAAAITVSPGSSATYTATSAVCPASASTTVTVNPAPAALTAVNASRCGPGSLQLGVTGNCNGTITWYDAPNAGNIVHTGATFNTPLLTQSTSYYVACVGACEGPRVEVQAQFVNNPPDISVTPAAELSCTTGQVQLSASSATPGVTFSWDGPGIVSGATTATPIVNIAGTYTVTVTNPTNGCTGQQSVTVSPNASQPNISIAPPGTLNCVNAELSLNGASSTPGVTFTWTGPGIISGGNASTAVVNLPGTYELTVTNPANGCSSTQTVTVDENTAQPDVSISPVAGLDCVTTEITLTGASTVPGVQYGWTGPGIINGANTATPSINQPGIYTLTVLNPANGCTNTSAVSVTLSGDLPDVSTLAPADLTCNTTQINLQANSATPGVTFSWTGPGIVSGAATAAPLVNAAGTYTVTVFNAANNCSAFADVTVGQNTVAPVIGIVPPNDINCVESSVVLSVTSDVTGVSYQWTGPGIQSGGSSADAQVNQPGNYQVTVTSNANGCSASTSVEVRQTTQPPDISINTPDVLTCSLTEVGLAASSSAGDVSFSWAGAGIISGGNSATAAVNQPGVYTVTVTDNSNGCAATGNITVDQNISTPEADAGIDREMLCIDPVLFLNGTSGTPGAQFQWTGPGIVSGADQGVVTINMSGTYILTVTDPANGCTATDEVVVTEDTNAPVVQILTPEILTCAVTEITINATTSAVNRSITWNGSGITGPTDQLSIQVDQAGFYQITVMDLTNGCFTSETVLVEQDIEVPDADAGTDPGLTCQTSQANLNGSSGTPGAIFSWTGPGILSGGNTATPAINATGTYILTVTNPASGCEATATVEVQGNVVVPDVSIQPAEVLTCAITSLGLTASSATPNVGFAWTGPGIISGGNTASPTINQPGEYIVTATEASTGCASTQSITVLQDIAIPDLILPGDAAITCTTTEIALTAASVTPSVSFSWSGAGLTGSGDGATATFTEQGIKTVTVTNAANACTNSGTVIINLDNTSPQVNAGAGQILNCVSGEATLSATTDAANALVQWSGPGIISGAQELTAIVNAAGIYSIEVINTANGCFALAEVEVVGAEPLTVAASIVNSACRQVSNGAIFLEIEGGIEPYNILWSNGSTQTALTNLGGGAYTVNITDLSGCSLSLTYTVEEGLFSVEAFSDASISLGDSVQLSGLVTGGSDEVQLLWTPAEFLSCTACLLTTTTPFRDMMYVFTAVDTNGCAASDTVFIEVDANYDLYFPSAFTPNGDGLNDRFKALGNTDLVTEFELQVFNRWGQMVFETNDINAFWDGTFKGERVPTDGFVHAARARFLDGNERTYKGVVVVLQ